MPLYEYKCESCEIVNEIQHRLSEPSPEKCPSCDGGPLRKLISQTAFVLKGSGWYADGYSGKTPASSKNNKQDGEKTKSEPKSDNAKPSKTPDPKPKAANA